MMHDEVWTALPRVIWWIIRLQTSPDTGIFVHFFWPRAETHTHTHTHSCYFYIFSQYWSTTWQHFLQGSLFGTKCAGHSTEAIKAWDNSSTCSLPQQSVITAAPSTGCCVSLTEEEVAVYTKNALPINNNCAFWFCSMRHSCKLTTFT